MRDKAQRYQTENKAQASDFAYLKRLGRYSYYCYNLYAKFTHLILLFLI